MRLTIHPLRGSLLAIAALQSQLAVTNILDLKADLRNSSQIYVTHETFINNDSGLLVRNINLIIFFHKQIVLSSGKFIVSCYVSYFGIDNKNMDNPSYNHTSRSGPGAPTTIYLSLKSNDFMIKSTALAEVNMERSIAAANWSIAPLNSGRKKLTLTVLDTGYQTGSAPKILSITSINGRVADSTGPPAIPIDVDVMTWFDLVSQLRLIGPVLTFVCAIAAFLVVKEPRSNLA